MRPIQYFSDEYLEQASKLSPTEIVEFLESMRLISEASPPSKSILISMKIPLNLLNAFKAKCSIGKIPYQTKIKELMRKYLEY